MVKTSNEKKTSNEMHPRMIKKKIMKNMRRRPDFL
jgi:hypothetical protein